MSEPEFEILINDLFANLTTDLSLSPVDNKKILGLINDFEDGEWRFLKFQNFVWNNIAETALSFEERENLIGKSQTSLIESSKKLRLTDSDKDIGEGSELAEIVLYGIMKYYFNALPVVPKIYHKQNIQDNAKGADSVHIVVDEKKDFSLWFGEAKFYKELTDSNFYKVIESVRNSLDKNKLKKENSIITNLQDLNGLIEDKQLLDNIKKTLSSQSSIDIIKPKINIPILLLHECKITSSYKEMNDKYKSELKSYYSERVHSYFKKQISLLFKSIHQYSSIKFHIILFPVPNKGDIIDKFIEIVKFYKNQ